VKFAVFEFIPWSWFVSLAVASSQISQSWRSVSWRRTRLFRKQCTS